jgi:hypothetical protein
MARRGNIRLLRGILMAGAVVFATSAVGLLAVPSWFNELLGFSPEPELDWAMRLIAVTLLALTGNLLVVARFGSTIAVLTSARVMQFSAFGLGAVTLLIPISFTWFTLAYAAVGFVFSAAYTVGLMMGDGTTVTGAARSTDA